jgi:D-glycero-beta-D-manno-heptose 1-phosphate adenylyltransferase
VGQVLSPDNLLRELQPRRAAGQRVVFTNGCYDLLHPGHVDLLERSRALGDLLIVAINSDAGVRCIKGPKRPLVPQAERAELLAGLESVDYVTFFDDPTPREIICRVLPDVLVKGGDWGLDAIVGRDEVEAAGGTVYSLPLLPGYSTTAIVEKIKKQNSAS